MKFDTTPVLVGIGQCTQRVDDDGPTLDPLSLMAEASAQALADADSARLASLVDRVEVVNIISWTYADAPAELAARLGLRPAETRYTTIGGNTPQTLVHRSAVALTEGRCRAVLLAGGESGASAARARKRKEKPAGWPERANPSRQDGDGRFGSNDGEHAYGLLLPSLMYPLIETAIRADRGLTPRAHADAIGRLFARLAGVAAGNPLAWFRTAHGAADIALPSKENRYVGYPYTKRMNAIMDVDQAAALVLTTAALASDLGIPPERWVYPRGGGEMNDVWYVTERPSLHRSAAIPAAAARAFEQAGATLDEVTAFDLYSCFPAAVELTMDGLGLGPHDPRPLTLTGGLPYFGGPGNNYSMHAIASGVARIRADREETVLVSALGWYCTKHALGIYGSRPPKNPWKSTSDTDVQAAIDATARPPLVEAADGSARVMAFVIRHDRSGEPVDGIVLVALDRDGSRALAKLDATAAELGAIEEEEEIVGRRGVVRPGSHDRHNTFSLA